MVSFKCLFQLMCICLMVISRCYVNSQDVSDSDVIDGKPEHLIKDVCYHDRHEYHLGQMWNATGVCEVYVCELVQIQGLGRNIKIAATVRKTCGVIPKNYAEKFTDQNTKCYEIPMANGQFPFCCPMLVCTTDRNVVVHTFYPLDSKNKLRVSGNSTDDRHLGNFTSGIMNALGGTRVANDESWEEWTDTKTRAKIPPYTFLSRVYH